MSKKLTRDDLAWYFVGGITLSIFPYIYRNDSFYYYSYSAVPFGLYLLYRFVKLRFLTKD